MAPVFRRLWVPM